ncbi:hypothetical protein K431DRAFT_252503 [Polychaeton citri CBS 116435]|uniref:Yeast cell wall synthesis Kre9/Knh1-like N-terminal domain-containing protein n=1 Tax=Polychaeton citri CBS 116435 TaxID=1314669 RepID=A0A9P4Q3T1_9PEZI|nr:hypothetical protein K431DRAFT_252503 [Polychaeton citri CBS 116435]
MQLKALFLGACAVALASAQSSVLTFTRVPNPITVGQAVALTYATNDTESPVSIILRKGTSTNLQTVATLTDNATGGQYIWTPTRELSTDNDYALEITQGSQVNYFGPFSIQGGSGHAPPGYGGSHSASATGWPSSYHSLTPSVSAYPTYSANSTTAYYPGTASSYGTASTISRNTTLSSATLSSSYKPTTAVTTTTAGSGSSTSGAGFQSPSARPTNAASGLKAGSSIALVFGAIAAVLYA